MRDKLGYPGIWDLKDPWILNTQQLDGCLKQEVASVLKCGISFLGTGSANWLAWEPCKGHILKFSLVVLEANRPGRSCMNMCVVWANVMVSCGCTCILPMSYMSRHVPMTFCTCCWMCMHMAVSLSALDVR